MWHTPEMPRRAPRKVILEKFAPIEAESLADDAMSIKDGDEYAI